MMEISLGGVVIAAAVAAIAYGVTRSAVVARHRRMTDLGASKRRDGPPVSRQVRRAQEQIPSLMRRGCTSPV